MSGNPHSTVLSRALATQAAGRHYVPLDGEYLQVPVVSVPLGSLLYRPQNGRIAVEALSFLRRHGLPGSFFSGEVSSPEIQKALETLLLEFARDPRGPIFAELARAKQQTEPLIVNQAGIVINGNRRLATMRALYAEDPKAYAGFENVEVAVLPEHIDEAAEERIEAALQMAPDTKLAYGWVHRRLKLRRQRDELGLPEEAIVQSYRLESAEQLAREIAQLELAEEYLGRFAEAPGEYERIAEHESLFVGLHGQLEELPSAMARVWKQAGFSLIHARGQLDVNLESYFPFASPKPARAPTVVVQRFGAEIGLWPSPNAAQEQAAVDEDRCRELEGALGNPASAVENAQGLVAILDAVAAEHRERRAPRVALKRLKQATDLINGIDLSTLDLKQRAALKGQLATIEYQARRLREACEAYDIQPVAPQYRAAVRRNLGRVLRALRLK